MAPGLEGWQEVVHGDNVMHCGVMRRLGEGRYHLLSLVGQAAKKGSGNPMIASLNNCEMMV